ncbi:MAG: response regulator transcription factor [Haliscomenobacter sp.]|nr:response regulator transcription factor [Haliscomenobacter sp.]MBP9075618.1 response regulator transcription factor [Haliscomenobacter sp.]MBP9873555.1 response regulator transcription factor [Haliscomenobacter sp.]
MTLKCIVVDDDPLSRVGLEKLCGRTESLELTGIFPDTQSAKLFLENEPADLVFMDIEQPEDNGLRLLSQLSYLPQVIIASAKPEFAFPALEYAVTDYLKKPISLPQFLRAVEKAFFLHQQSQFYKERAQEVYIRQEGKLLRVKFADILFLETVGDYVRIKAKTNAFLIHDTLKGLEEKIKDPRFLKVHRSYIVNLDEISEIGEHILMNGRHVIPVSRANRPVLLRRLNVL